MRCLSLNEIKAFEFSRVVFQTPAIWTETSVFQQTISVVCEYIVFEIISSTRSGG